MVPVSAHTHLARAIYILSISMQAEAGCSRFPDCIHYGDTAFNSLPVRGFLACTAFLTGHSHLLYIWNMLVAISRTVYCGFAFEVRMPEKKKK